jgi:ABC-type transport system involved in multi-copper enzyme maturation permease subunit
MIRQTLALLLDAYRDLNSRRMFWIVLILSGLVAASFGGIGLTPTGFEILWWKFPSPFFNSQYITPGDFYKTVFLSYGIGFWLTWLATILAIISTASLFPDFIATGAVDLYLSKPIGRLRLFLTKYLCGLLFVTLQIVCFCVTSILVIGIRGGAWEFGIFLAVPFVVLFFSYLFCFCVLVGVWTRSTIAAVLLTLLFWLGVFGVHTTEVVLLTAKIAQDSAAERIDKQIAATEKSLAKAEKIAATRPTTRNTESKANFAAQLERQHADRAGITHSFDTAHQIFYDIKTVLPKTSETMALLERKMIDTARLQRVAQTQQDPQDQPQIDFNGNPVDVKRLQAEFNKRTSGWIVGTSLGFEAVVIALAAWIFSRRDY